MSLNKPIKRPTFNKKNDSVQLPSSIALEKETKLMEEKLRKLKQAMSFESEKINSTKERWKNSKNQPSQKKTYSQVIEAVRTSSRTGSRNSVQEKAIESESNIKNYKTTDNVHLLADKNITMALAMQKTNGHKDVSAFFEKIKLKQYFQIFIENGFDDIEIIKDITVEELNYMKITANHQEKIMNALQKKDNPQKRSDFCQPGPSLSPVKNSKKNKNIEVEFDEEKSHESFLEALMGFRNSTKNDSQTTEKKVIIKNKEAFPEINENDEFCENSQNDKFHPKNDRKAEEYKELQAKAETPVTNKQKPFSLFGLSEGEWKNIDPRNINEKGVGTEKKGERFSCWECLKILKTPIYKQIGNRIFCGEQCLKEFKRSNELKCNGCSKTCFKLDGTINFNLFYCSNGCCIDKKTEGFGDSEKTEGSLKEIDLKIDKKEIPTLDQLFNK